MKLFVFILTASLLFACNNDKNVKVNDTALKSEADVKGIVTPVDEKTQKIEMLKKLAPVDLEELYAMLPAELNGMKRVNLHSSTNMGYAYTEGTYQKGKSNLQVMIYDCGGEAGTIWYMDTYSTKLDVVEEDENGYKKTIDLLGGKAIESYKKEGNVTTLTFMGNERTLIILSGKNISSDALREIARSFNKKA